jgi:hypothetical protein
MSRLSPRQITLEELISLAEASHANPTASQESDKAKTMSATCGLRCLTLSEPFVPSGSWARTFAGLLIGMEGWSSKRCALTWKIQGTPSNRIYYQLLPSELPTDATEFGLLPTPTTDERDAKYKQGGTNLRAALKGMLPTPTTRDYKGARSSETLHATGRNGTNSLPDAFAQAGKTSQLNPRFVAEMMGFPVNWTELPFLSGEQKA